VIERAATSTEAGAAPGNGVVDSVLGESAMTVAEQRERKRDDERQEHDALKARIGERVIHTLGKPDALHAVQVRWLWGDYFRVNVLVGADVTSARFAHSFFLLTDGNGHILSSTPLITRKY
jgi:hypothetical protein